MSGTQIGNNMLLLQLPQPKPGRYFISVTNTNSSKAASYTLAAGWFDKSNDSLRDELLLSSGVRFDGATQSKAQEARLGSAAIADDDDEEWEVGSTVQT